MARTSITTARYNPFTMEELYSPVLRATEQHLQQQEKYDELANQALMWKYRIPNDPNSAAYQMYNDFSNNLESMTNDLQTNGILSPSARDNFSNLRKTNPIPVLEDSWNRREADRQMREKLGEDAVWENPLGSLDDYITNSVNNNYISQQNVHKRGAETAIAIAKSITADPSYERILGNQYFQKIEREGIPKNVLLAAQTNDISYMTDAQGNISDNDMTIYSMLRQAYENDASSLGYNNWANPEARGRLDDSYWNGMLQGLETTKESELVNKDHIDRATSIQLGWKAQDRAIESENRARIDRLARGQATPEDMWYARYMGVDPETGTRVSPTRTNSNSSSSSGGGGSSMDHIHHYSPRINKKNGTVISDTASLNAARNSTSTGSNANYHPVLFTDLTSEQQRTILSNMGYTKAQQDAMFNKGKPKSATTVSQALGITPRNYEEKFVGTLDLGPDFLNHYLDIQINDATGDMYSVGKSWNTSMPTGQTVEEYIDNYIGSDPNYMEQVIAPQVATDTTLTNAFKPKR